MNRATKRLYELQINALQSAPRDREKLEWILKKKEKVKKKRL